MAIQYRIRKDGETVGDLIISEVKEEHVSTVYNGVISLFNRVELEPMFFTKFNSHDEIKTVFIKEHGGAGYELAEEGFRYIP